MHECLAGKVCLRSPWMELLLYGGLWLHKWTVWWPMAYCLSVCISNSSLADNLCLWIPIETLAILRFIVNCLSDWFTVWWTIVKCLSDWCTVWLHMANCLSVWCSVCIWYVVSYLSDTLHNTMCKCSMVIVWQAGAVWWYRLTVYQTNCCMVIYG